MHLPDCINDGYIMLARTTSGSRKTPRWSVPEAGHLSDESEVKLRSRAKRDGINVYGGGGSHLWFWWSLATVGEELGHETMRDMTINMLNAAISPPF